MRDVPREKLGKEVFGKRTTLIGEGQPSGSLHGPKCCKVVHAPEDAEALIVKTALELAQTGETNSDSR